MASFEYMSHLRRGNKRPYGSVVYARDSFHCGLGSILNNDISTDPPSSPAQDTRPLSTLRFLLFPSFPFIVIANIEQQLISLGGGPVGTPSKSILHLPFIHKVRHSTGLYGQKIFVQHGTGHFGQVNMAQSLGQARMTYILPIHPSTRNSF